MQYALISQIYFVLELLVLFQKLNKIEEYTMHYALISQIYFGL